jgi:hypothetical protein
MSRSPICCWPGCTLLVGLGDLTLLGFFSLARLHFGLAGLRRLILLARLHLLVGLGDLTLLTLLWLLAGLLLRALRSLGPASPLGRTSTSSRSPSCCCIASDCMPSRWM